MQRIREEKNKWKIKSRWSRESITGENQGKDSRYHDHTVEEPLIRKLGRLTLLLISILFGLSTIVATSGDSGDSTAVVPEVTDPATIAIVSPLDQQAYLEGDFISFISQISDADADETYTYSWASSIDGDLGTTANLNLNTLTAGTHIITLTLSGAAGNTVDSDSVTITVGESTATPDNTAPVAIITAPSTDVSFNVGEAITFTGTGTDAEDGDLTGTSLVWSSSLDSALGTGATLLVDTLSAGEHIITLTATDSVGSSVNAFIIITVGGDNATPTVRIISPADSAGAAATYDVNAGDAINFVGTATDFDGTPITEENLEWISSKDGHLFYGDSLTLNSRSVESLGYDPLKEGEHTIYLRATGSTGTAQAGITINLTNTQPVAEITNPPETCPETDTLCQTFGPGQYINFQGTGTDAEDGNLSGESLEWSSDIDGFLGTGESLYLKTDNVQALGNVPMSDGTHVITLTAIDEWGQLGIDSLVIQVGSNTAPVPSITYPTEDYTSTTNSGFITFYGQAEDAEEGSLTSDDMVWYRSDQQGALVAQEPSGANTLTSSVRLDLSTFSSGTHTITLVATDRMGKSSPVSRNITVP